MKSVPPTSECIFRFKICRSATINPTFAWMQPSADPIFLARRTGARVLVVEHSCFVFNRGPTRIAGAVISKPFDETGRYNIEPNMTMGENPTVQMPLILTGRCQDFKVAMRAWSGVQSQRLWSQTLTTVLGFLCALRGLWLGRFPCVSICFVGRTHFSPHHFFFFKQWEKPTDHDVFCESC